MLISIFWSEWRDLNSRLPLAVPEMRSPRSRSAHFDRCAFPLLAVSATGGARRESLTRGSRGNLKSYRGIKIGSARWALPIFGPSGET